MEAGLILLSIYLFVYAVYILRLTIGYGRVKNISAKNASPKVTFSIVVPFRNEEQALPKLLESIGRLNYPKTMFEVIFIDDLSVDDSQRKIYKWRMENGKFHITLIENVRVSGSPKKDAIMRAMPIVANDWIVTTDADCVLPENWLAALNDFVTSEDVSMIAAPVVYRGRNSFLKRFQRNELISLQGATIGGFGLGKAFMCNGANFAYRKTFFNELGGFSGNSEVASGDDVFLLQKAAAQFPKKIGYLKSADAIVFTEPANSWKELFHQRVRWASKTASYESEFGETLAWVVFLGNLSIVIFIGLAVAERIPASFAVTAFFVKALADLALLLRANRFFKTGLILFPFPSLLLYPFFSVAVALYSAVGKYEWKGRKFR